MALDPIKWQVQADKDIRYIGPTHGQNGANYATVLELYRWFQGPLNDVKNFRERVAMRPVWANLLLNLKGGKK